jgi:hypothetical protein
MPEVVVSRAASILKNLQSSGKTAPVTPDPLTVEDVEDRKSDRKLKTIYAFSLLSILVLQLAVMNLVFWRTGSGNLSFEKWTLDLYMTGTLAEVFGVVLVITKHLFPNRIS